MKAEYLTKKPEVESARRSIASGLVQIFRYAIVGVGVNVLAFALYLFLTYNGTGPKLAATICFACGVAIGFVLNRSWSFGNRAAIRHTMPRYVIAYAVAYGVNIFGLYALVDVLGYPHQLVQILLVLVIACGLFVAQRFWIFAGVAENY